LTPNHSMPYYTSFLKNNSTLWVVFVTKLNEGRNIRELSLYI
jgi:hypothetical protein